ncbi:armadillo-type protein [Entophlyctis helioformis]|nr:armadillo-type protein [Entophlyctis helioformis]
MLARVQAKKSQPKPTVTRSIPFGESTGTGTGTGTAGFPDVDPNALPVADNELREYFRHMEKLMEEQEFETTDDMQLFIQNAYAELKGKELAIAGDFEGSRILEKLLRGSSDIQVRSQAYRFAGDFRRLVTHQFASHVVQTLLLLAADVVEREVDGEVAGFEKTMDEDDLDAEEIEWRNKLPSMEKILVALCGECDGEWSRLLLDPYASHVIRTLLNVLSGESLADDSSIRSKKSSKYNKNHNNAFVAKKPGVKRRTPESFAALLTSIVDSLTANLQDADLRIMATHPVANPVLQTLLEIPHASTTLVPAFLKDGDFFKMLIEHQVGSHLAEKLVAKSSAMAFAGLFETHIRPRFLELCNHPLANFVIQRVLDKVSDQTQLDALLDIIEPEMERMLFRSRAGIVVKTIEACSRVPACQKRVLKALFAAVHTAGDDAKMKKCASVILLMTTYEKYEVLDLAPSLQGALMLQHVASFTPENAKLCVESIMAMEPESLFKWALDPIASRVVEAILASHTLALRTQRRLVRNFFGRFVELSSDKYGSHLVDKCWAVSNMDMRETIAQELADKMTSLAANFHAKFILRNCKVELYKKRRDEWVERQQAEIKRREMAMEMRSAPGGGGVAAAAAADDAGGVPEGGEKKKKKRKNPPWMRSTRCLHPN